MSKKHTIVFVLLFLFAFSFGFAFTKANTAQASNGGCCFYWLCTIEGEPLIGHQRIGDPACMWTGFDSCDSPVNPCL